MLELQGPLGTKSQRRAGPCLKTANGRLGLQPDGTSVDLALSERSVMDQTFFATALLYSMEIALRMAPKWNSFAQWTRGLESIVPRKSQVAAKKKTPPTQIIIATVTMGMGATVGKASDEEVVMLSLVANVVSKKGWRHARE